MPLIVTLDEYDTALTSIALHAELGLASTDPGQREAALRLILDQCRRVKETVEDVLTSAVGLATTCNLMMRSGTIRI